MSSRQQKRQKDCLECLIDLPGLYKEYFLRLRQAASCQQDCLVISYRSCKYVSLPPMLVSRRSKVEVAIDVLKAIKGEKIKRTQIMQRANLSLPVFTKELQRLEGRMLVKTEDEGGEVHVSLTETGFQMLNSFHGVAEAFRGGHNSSKPHSVLTKVTSMHKRPTTANWEISAVAHFTLERASALNSFSKGFSYARIALARA